MQEVFYYRGRKLARCSNAADERRNFQEASEHVVSFFLVIVRIHKARIGDGGDTHPGGFSGENTGYGVLNDEAGPGGEVQLFSDSHINIRMWLAAFDFVPGHYDIEEAADSRPLEEWTRGCAY